jgi:excisionase family DNA binding protein
VEASEVFMPLTQKAAQSVIPLLVSKQQAAAMLGVSLRTITTLIGRKQLACRRIGRRTLVPHASLIDFARRDHPTCWNARREVEQ